MMVDEKGYTMTINDKANKELEKALKALRKASDALIDTPEYWNNKATFHNTTVNAVNRIITATQILNDL